MKKNLNGQALITLLFFVIIAMTLTAFTTTIVIANSQGANSLQQGQIAYYLAESGVENAILRILRDPNYSGETLNLEGDTVYITVSGTTTKIITSSANTYGFTKTIQVIANYNNDILTISSWKEVY